MQEAKQLNWLRTSTLVWSRGSKNPGKTPTSSLILTDANKWGLAWNLVRCSHVIAAFLPHCLGESACAALSSFSRACPFQRHSGRRGMPALMNPNLQPCPLLNPAREWDGHGPPKKEQDFGSTQHVFFENFDCRSTAKGWLNGASPAR